MKTRVKELREQKDINQTALAVRAGCSQNTISKIELGECDPKASILKEMSKYFGVSVDYILCLTDYKNYNEIQARYGNQPDAMREYVECLYRISDESKILVKAFAERLAELESESKERKK